MQFQFSRFSSFVEEILHEICATPHWMHLKRSIMMGQKPSSNESDFTTIFSRLGSLCKHDIPMPDVYQIEMSPVFGHKESYNLTTPQSDSIVAVEEAKQYTHGKKVLSLTGLPIGYSVIVALTGLPIGYSVIVALTGLPIGYSVIVALTGLPMGYSVIVTLTGLPMGYSVIVTLTGLPMGYSVIVALTGLPIGYSVSPYRIKGTTRWCQ